MLRHKSRMTGIIIATRGVLFRNALPKAIGGRILSWAPSIDFGRPINRSLNRLIAPVEYIPAATTTGIVIVLATQGFITLDAGSGR